MPRKSTRGSQGAGTIRKKSVMRNGQAYTYWEARVTVGRDPGTGKQIQKSFSGKTQKEVREKLQAAAVAINDGMYRETTKMTVGDWLDVWTRDYLGDVKPFTVVSYKGQVENHIKPALGAVKLELLTPHAVQHFYNSLSTPSVVKMADGTTKEKPGLSPKSVKNVHGVLHRALQQAVENQYIRTNPTDVCKLPRRERKDIKPLDEEQITRFLTAIKGHCYEAVYTVTMFTGMREGEALGLMWDCIDFKAGTILIDKQLQREKKKNAEYVFASLKNGKSRKITPAPWVMNYLKIHKREQTKARLRAGEAWEDSGLVFTNEVGHHLATHTVYKKFKSVVSSIGCPDARFHDLRHSYAVAAIRAGDDIKTVQGNLGHATAAFTLDVYGHVTEQMKQASAERMDTFIKGVLNL